MHLNPYGRDPVTLAVDLVNRPLRGAADLERRCAEVGFLLERPVGEDDVAAVGEFLERWTRVVDAADAPARAERLNPLLIEFSAAPRLTDHAGTGWHLHYRPDLLPAHRQVAALVSVGTALHLTGRGMDRLGRCAAHGCDRVYADFSRGGRQRYCSPACGNRDAVRRHRARAARP
ncbi:CGNR zinc finger domain-containing protein [Nocardiopsis akebiae]|uniref:CGNR zinc finger domain-containing protein n=1 Tax=Nocardiopsis akebiae TaxID=2831968 RepID=A0ABX8CD31_9ACTN|nr:CGNR zinc finger domain-containing protein [Nocardiopsis akebiae]QUX31514.1 CGNR zinc finger domain-containing protein [Nocardiopsis akebiae]